MSRRLILSLLCVSAVVVFVQFSSANSRLTVNEATGRFLIQDQPIVVLAVVNPAPQILSVRLYLDLLDPADKSRGRAIRDVVLQPGSNTLSTPINLNAKSLNADRDENLPWYRVRYRVEALSGVATPPEPATGIISISQMDTPDIFSLEVSAPRAAQRGMNQHVHVRAFHPLTRKPVADVRVIGELKLDNDELKPLRSSGITDAQGHALLTFTIPAKLVGDEGEIKVSGRHGGFVCETSDDIELHDEASVVVTTDKPIYQPGQALHVRALVFNSNKHAAANAAATLKILDPENATVFETELVSSRFGVVTGDWTIPESTRFGNYAITVNLDDEIYGSSSGSQLVKISRYDLPNFTVSAKADRRYYLPQENAEVEVHADYLFGQPVKRGHVRVVREAERSWNYEAQKWNISEQEEYEGDTDAKGVFKVHLDLSQLHEDLKSDDYLRFRDVTYAAYFTDPTSNRTEERRFDLRITRDAIHIYVAEGSERQARGFPMEFFVATSFADGTPAPADVAISEVIDEQNRTGPVIKTLRTNKYGIARVSGLLLANADATYPSAKFVAHAGSKTGQHTESFYYSDAPVLRIRTDKIFYRPGDTIKVDIASSEPQMNLFVDVATEANLIESRLISTVNGAATFSLRYRPEFRDQLTIAAYAKSLLSQDGDVSFGSRTVLFPRDRDLKLNFTLDRADYKPGEDATVDFRVLTPDGRPASSALGVVVFDRAVEERARVDQDFGGTFGFYGSFSRWRGYDDQVGGITRKDLQRVDLSKPLPEAIESVAELLLSSVRVTPSFFNSTEFASDHTEVFAAATTLQLQPVTDILEGQYQTSGVYPENGDTLRRLLFESGVKFTELLDPWGTPYRDQFFIEREQSVMDVVSAGPDKTFSTADDFSVKRITRPYFRFNAEAIKRAVQRFHARTGGFIRDAATLRNELRLEGLDFDALRDPWGRPYDVSFTTNRQQFYVTVRSSGPNQRLEPDNGSADDFVLSTTGIDYLTETRGRVTRALAEYSTNTNALPHDEAQLQRALSSFDQNTLIDPWGNHFYSVFDTSARYADRVTQQNIGTYGKPLKAHTEITPVTQQITTIKLRSSGEDGKRGTADDFDVVEFSQLTSEQARQDQKAEQTAQLVFFSGSRGAIKGTVVDPMGAVIPFAKITATNKITLQEFSTETDDSGRYLLRNLPVGLYSLRCDAVYFKSAVISDVPVASSNIATVDLTLEVGTVTETVSVVGGKDVTLNTTSSTVTAVSEGPMRVSIGTTVQLSTPRLREYFPETLVWSPGLETDKQGRAQLKFKLADNITTWKMSVLGSTEDGEVGTAEAEIKAFQPFFVEHDPPRVLTEGDRIALPVVLRNYLARAQTVDLEITPEKWFTLQGPARQQATVAAGDAARETFDFTAIASIKDGKQRITARSAEAGDAIEKPVTVHPDGAERTQTAGDLFDDAVTLNLDLPNSVIPGSTRAELKVYPNLMAHVIESVDGILERPHGCGEQTISSTYPSLLILRRDRQTGTNSKVHEKAKRYAELGYQRLLNYRSEDGGFTYWGRGEADLALTAYALRFLHDARNFVEVNEEVIDGARAWLIKRQQVDGSWPSHSYDENDKQRKTAMLSALVTRVLAMTADEVKVDGTANAKQAPFKLISPELKRALTYLAGRVEQINEPYLISTYALAAMDAGDDAAATSAVAKLRALARTEADTTYWTLETNTPFYGWGLAGRVETTALAVQALARHSAADGPLVRRGLLFLLRAKDRYGVWYSTQATINVLDTLITLLRTNETGGGANGSPVEIVVNGNRATALELTRRDQTGGIFRDDISRFLHPGTNRIELRRASGGGFASVQAVANYYVPWTASESAPSGALRLQAKFDRQAAQISEEITCHVNAERVGFSGYGMMLAEIGLPPGADVDRASLESAMKNSDWAFSQYDILPDRLVVYLWPRAGGVAFDFKFRPRFGLTAKAAPSMVYDYYNPEARAVVAPVTFVVK